VSAWYEEFFNSDLEKFGRQMQRKISRAVTEILKALEGEGYIPDRIMRLKEVDYNIYYIRNLLQNIDVALSSTDPVKIRDILINIVRILEIIGLYKTGIGAMLSDHASELNYEILLSVLGGAYPELIKEAPESIGEVDFREIARVLLTPLREGLKKFLKIF